MLDMDINRLSQDELAYELTIRDLKGTSVEEMRKLFRIALRAEKEKGAAYEYPPYPYTFQEDKEALFKKIDEISELVESFKGDEDSGEYKKITSKLQWGLNRLKRMSENDSEQKQTKIVLRSSYMLMMGTLRDKIEGIGSEDDLDDEGEITQSSFNVTSKCRHRVSVEKWNIRFSGEKGQSLNSFLERVAELAEARGVTKGQLFKSALDLFEGRALLWYRANKNRCSCWADLVKELRKEYLPVDYDDRLTEEIKKRTQGRSESIGTYVAIMESMFSRLTTPLSEESRLKILKRNIDPFYQGQLGLHDITTTQALVDLGRKLEAVKESVESFVPPPSRRTGALLEPDLAYMSSTAPSIASVASEPYRPKFKCFNCRMEGHTARFCRQSRRCYGCGRVGIIRINCPNCRPNNRANFQNPSVVKEARDQGNEIGARQ